MKKSKEDESVKYFSGEVVEPDCSCIGKVFEADAITGAEEANYGWSGRSEIRVVDFSRQ